MVGYEFDMLSVNLLRLLRMVVLHAASQVSVVVIAANLLSHLYLRLFKAKILQLELQVEEALILLAQLLQVKEIILNLIILVHRRLVTVVIMGIITKIKYLIEPGVICNRV